MWKWNKRIETINGEDGLEIPSYLDSLLAWRLQLSKDQYWDVLKGANGGLHLHAMSRSDVIKMFWGKLGKEPTPECPQCNDKGQIIMENETGDNKMWCLCSLLSWIQEKRFSNEKFESHYEKTSLTTFNLVGNSTTGLKNESLVQAARATSSFIQNPTSRWLILTGPYGLGKTHLLRSIATEFHGIALYLRAQDMNTMIFEAMNDKESIGKIVQKISRSPILLLDDVGAEYRKDFITSILTDIIDFRWSDRHRYPLAVTTNESMTNLRDSWGRIGDRLTDKDNNIIGLAGKSYRQA